jgi:hypothetical protein
MSCRGEYPVFPTILFPLPGRPVSFLPKDESEHPNHPGPEPGNLSAGRVNLLDFGRFVLRVSRRFVNLLMQENCEAHDEGEQQDRRDEGSFPPFHLPNDLV